MQSISVYLVPNKVDVFTTHPTEWTIERYRRVYNRNLKVYRGVDNRIDLQVRNPDQKPTEIVATTLVFTLIEREQQKKVLEKDCSVVNTASGKFFVNLLDSELVDIESGFYQYSIRTETRSSNNDNTYNVISSKPLYIDGQYDALGTIEIYGSLSGESVASTVVTSFNKNITDRLDTDYFTSGIIDARPQLSNAQTLHTFQLYCTDYTGRVTIQGNLDGGGNPQDWTDIYVIELFDTDLEYINIEGKYSFFRFKHQPNAVGVSSRFSVNQTIFFAYDVSLSSPGVGYQIGQDILIKGNQLGGETPTNDLIITVTDVDSNGGIVAFTWAGRSYNGVANYLTGSSIINSGTFDKILYR